MGNGAVGYVLGIAKAYTTRVGDGPFPTELNDEIGQRLGTRGNEFGTNTGRPRRCGWFDAVMVRQAVKLNGIDGIALTKLDVLDGEKEIKVCVAYELDGKRIERFPFTMGAQAKLKPIWETFEGWSESTHGARSFAELPATCIKYVRRVEELVGCPVALLSTSPAARGHDPDDGSVPRLIVDYFKELIARANLGTWDFVEHTVSPARGRRWPARRLLGAPGDAARGPARAAAVPVPRHRAGCGLGALPDRDLLDRVAVQAAGALRALSAAG